MGQLERKKKQRAPRGSVERSVLETLATIGDMLTIVLVKRSATLLVRRAMKETTSKPEQRVRETISRLKRKGFIEFRGIRGKSYPRLTRRGREHMQRLQIGALRIERPSTWDGRWRIVIFDIRENQSGIRTRVRRLLQQLEFLQLQKSVWVHPYDCEEIIKLIKTDLHIGRNILYIIADVIEYYKPLRQHFGLSTR